MQIWSTASTLTVGRREITFSLVGHAALILITLFVHSLGLFPEPADLMEVQMVRLKGGGDTTPGWVDPTPVPARPDESTEPDDLPLPEPEADLTEPEPAPAETVEPVPEAPAAPSEEEQPQPQQSSQAAAEPSATPAETGAEPEQTGTGVGRRPGPEGPGVGAVSDTDFAGASSFLSRIEAEVQRRFNYRGQSTGKVAEYHFTIDKQGKMHDLVLMESSGVPSLDLAARSALIRANFPPLPRTFPHNQLGVTYRFHSD